MIPRPDASRRDDSRSRHRLKHERRILADIDEAEAAARAERREPMGRFVVAAPNVFGRLRVAPVMCEYLTRNPKVVGELIVSDAVANLIDDGIDVAVRSGRLPDSSLIARRVGETRRVIVGAPKYLERRGRPSTPMELAKHALIQFTAISPMPEWRFHHAGTMEVRAFSPGFVTNSADAAIGHAQRGGGLTMVLYYQVIDAVQAGTLEVVLAQHEAPPLPIHLVHPAGRQQAATVTAFEALVHEICDWRFV